MAWRAGRKVGRTIYEDDNLIGVMDTPELAAKVVTAVNVVQAMNAPWLDLAQAVVGYFGEGELTPSADGCSGLRDKAREILGLPKLSL